jgi:tartrate-resistant acid phosphatase type 5
MKNLFTLLLAFCIYSANLFSQGAGKFDNGYRGISIPELQTPKKAVSFLVVGDWGRNGEYMQLETARQMGAAAAQLEAACVISVGDNFYPKGVVSTADPLWQNSFEKIYTAHSLQEDWFVVLGNHDYKTNPQAQIEYSRISRRWKMPSRYYTQTLEAGKANETLLVFLDTNPFEKKYYTDEEELFRKHIQQQAADTLTQRKWLDSVLSISKAKWKLVFGHHPFYSAGKRKGLTDDVASSLQSILVKNKADAYIAGHEHHLEHDVLSNNLHHFISGAGSEVRPVTNNTLTKFVAAEHGFMTFSVTDKSVLVQVVNHEGKILYHYTIQK